MEEIKVMVADESHIKYVDIILETIAEAAKVRGTGIAKRSTEYVATKMREAKAVIALQGDKFAGFSYIETWGNKQYVTTSGLIVHPDFRGLGLAKKIKNVTFTLARKRWPHAKIFSLTSGSAVMKMNTQLGYLPVTFADLTDDELKRAIVYMTNQSGGNFEAPAVGAADGAASDASGADAAAAPVAAGSADGKKVFEGLCMACHAADSAIPFSPKITHNAEWTTRLKQGKATLVKHAIEGYTGPDGGVMPPKGGNANLTDAEIEAAVVYMANQSGGNLK